MKRFTVLLLLATIAAISCQKFDDSQIWKELNDHKNRIVLLEELCRKLNTDIINLQTIVTALETNDYIISASPLVTGDGYTFLFKSGKSIVIYNGKDGSNGKDGAAPQVGVKKDTDGIYYWTINGEWLIVDGKKVKASATDGSNGENGTNGIDGTDGITPQFKIEEGYWYVSYDNCVSWEMLGKAIGDNGLNGANGDSFFKGVEIKDGFVIFMLNDGKDSTIKIPLQKDTVLEISLQDSERLRAVISSEEMRTVTKLKVKGVISDEDMRFLQHFISLEELDLSETTFCEGVFYLNPSLVSGKKS